MKFSANLGFLWSDLPLPQAIHAAHAAGFDAVECHWPYATPAADTAAALHQTGLKMLGLNTSRGNPGENGLAALPNREPDARAAIDQAIAYARAINTPNIHVMAGFATGPQAHATYLNNLHYACTNASSHGITILVEPLNRHDAPGYFLTTTTQAAQIIQTLAIPNLKLMFDCYHTARTEGDVTHRLRELLPIIGHIQIASVPDRGTPDHGELDHAHLFQTLKSLGYTAPIGAEYKPTKPTDETLDWLKSLRLGSNT
ncbi:hydroxypyruvate isomerase [Pseudorhodobacter antarcticus]|uniref:Hydroxypyruvate isomerase n=1 Tax=Pseudorhodobacter antarcticus TaxID=1077947 RepID=A0A1H8EBG0_9RHOB|nr:TIM barrel protein [Pseudorhodobacter antarcticus]SEN16849.1 hydroxypyruvate isomerase [Pseudorhodobacter antarcticus]